MSEKDELEGTEEFYEHEQVHEQEEESVNKSHYHMRASQGGRGKRTSHLWNKFTIINDEKQIAECNLCAHKLSFRSSVSNLKKHLIRKHGYGNSNKNFRPGTFKIKREPAPLECIQPRPTGIIKRKTLTDLTGLDGLILNVVAEEGEHPLADENGHIQGMEEVYTSTGETHDYCVTDGERRENQSHYSTTLNGDKTTGRILQSDKSDRMKRSQIMDLQLECLEIKKYTMQMEALILERQLNLPRSLFTETLTENDTRDRGTQTDIGGNNTKVFYVSDSNGVNKSSSQHFFTFQASLDE